MKKLSYKMNQFWHKEQAEENGFNACADAITSGTSPCTWHNANFGTVDFSPAGSISKNCYYAATDLLQASDGTYRGIVSAGISSGAVLLGNSTFVAETLGVIIADGCKVSGSLSSSPADDLQHHNFGSMCRHQQASLKRLAPAQSPNRVRPSETCNTL
jgi:hypothetical protein